MIVTPLGYISMPRTLHIRVASSAYVYHILDHTCPIETGATGRKHQNLGQPAGRLPLPGAVKLYFLNVKLGRERCSILHI